MKWFGWFRTAKQEITEILSPPDLLEGPKKTAPTPEDPKLAAKREHDAYIDQLVRDNDEGYGVLDFTGSNACTSYEGTVPKCLTLLYHQTGEDQRGKHYAHSYCTLPPGHEGKHGLPDVEYVHPDEYPNRIGLSPKDSLRELLQTINELNEQVEKVRAGYDIQGLC